jgi:hypothetical protein
MCLSVQEYLNIAVINNYSTSYEKLCSYNASEIEGRFYTSIEQQQQQQQQQQQST